MPPKDNSEAFDPTPYVIASKKGDAKAFEALIREYTPKIYGMVINMTHQHEDTLDLLQEIFAKAYKAIAKYEQRSSFYTWLYRIAYNHTLNHVKRRKNKDQLSIDEFEENSHFHDPNLVDQTVISNPERQNEVNELQKRLNVALETLSEKHRAVVTMFDIQGLPHAEIAEIIGVSVGTVRSRLHYAHQQLQNNLRDLYEND